MQHSRSILGALIGLHRHDSFAVALTVFVGLWVAAGASARTPCSLDKPGACFEPVPDGFVGALVEAEMEAAIVVIPVSPESNFVATLPDGTRRIHQNVSGVPLFYCPNAVGPVCTVSPFVGEGRVNADVVETPAGQATCPSVVHIQGEVVDPETGDSFDVDAELVLVPHGGDACRLVTLDVNADPS